MGRIEKKALTAVSILLFVFCVSGIALLFSLQGSELLARSAAVAERGSLMDYLEQTDSDTKAVEKLHSLCLTLPVRHSASDVSVVAEEVYRTYRIRIADISASYFADYPVSGNGSHIKDLRYEMDGSTAELTLTTDEALFIESSFEGQYVFFDFMEPKERFDRIVVVDAGHGGTDDGARSGGVSEKDINLAIVKYFKSLTDQGAAESEDYLGDQVTTMELDGVGTVGVFYTRLADTWMDPKGRSALPEALGADLFLSVHINSTATGRISDINGANVLYRAGDKSGESKAFADLVMAALKEKLGCRDRGSIAGDDIYIVRSAAMPVALAEIGFITNERERALLTSKGYQRKAASALVEAVEAYLKGSKDR